MLKPGGRLIIVDMLPHDRENYRQQMGHVWLGFSDEQIATLLRDAGFEPVRVVAAAARSEGKGPGLFVATGRRPSRRSRRNRTAARIAVQQGESKDGDCS